MQMTLPALTYARQRAKEEALRLTPEGRKTIRAETRTYVRRDAEGKETVFRVSLDDKLVFVRWGDRHAEPRQQRLWYDTDRDARSAYFARLDALSARPLLDITARSVELAKGLVAAGIVPARASEDALHISIATVHFVDYLLTWNFRHIANPEIQARIAEHFQQQGLLLPFICTHDELLGDENG